MAQSRPNRQDPQNQSDLDKELARHFPNMKPVKKSPSLFTYNGFGLSLAGKRDFHQQTGTYIKSHLITLLFIPILSLEAYRVADAQNGGWYFLGKEKFSAFASIWNKLFLTFL